MKCSELINQLQELIDKHGDKEVILSITDHTDWEYNFTFPTPKIDKVYDDDFPGDEEYIIMSQSI